jgi:hypothetical protein
LVAKGPALDPARLLPALARFGEPGAAPAKRGAALRYVRFALDLLRCTDGWGGAAQFCMGMVLVVF